MNGYKKNMLHSPKKTPCTTGQWEKILAQTNSSPPPPPLKSQMFHALLSQIRMYLRVEWKRRN